MNQYNLDTLNKLLCTFSYPEYLDDTINNIITKYTLTNSKMFILESEESDELVCTYNLDLGNVNGNIPNTILLHRKKESNTLYSINALNILIKLLNNGRTDTNYIVDWKQYSNCILLTDKNNGLRRLNTKIKQIIEI